jgi:hypothetical protein
MRSWGIFCFLYNKIPYSVKTIYIKSQRFDPPIFFKITINSVYNLYKNYCGNINIFIVSIFFTVF